MATTFPSMSFNTQFHPMQCVDPSDIETFVDFGASMTSPSSSTAKGKASMNTSRSMSVLPSPTNMSMPLDFEEQQVPIKPSHEYERFKQQTGLPTGSYGSLTGLMTDFDTFEPGLASDSNLGSSSMFHGMGSSTGLASDADLNLDGTSPSTDFPAFFYPAQSNEDFVDPSSITSQPEPSQHIRFYPGMHQQQAALARAQQEAQQKQQVTKRRPSEQQNRSGRKSSSSVDARTEETIARVVNQIRQNNASSLSQGAQSPSASSQFARSRREEEDMDEDERLLASDEGKKLTSKERRQLRNKVSARAFRSRRKEYISQMEGEVQSKVNEMNDLRVQNRALMEENARFRELTVKLLRHPAFTPFLDDLSRDPALTESLTNVQNSMSASSAAGENLSAPQDTKPSPSSFEAQQTENLHIGMATVPETQLDFSALNLDGSSNWALPGMASMNAFSFQPAQVYAVTELPAAPSDIEQELGAIKGEACVIERFTPVSDAKEDLCISASSLGSASYPESAAVNQSIELDADFALYNDTATTPATIAGPPFQPILTDFATEKIFGYDVVTEGCADVVDRRLASVSARCERIFSTLDRLSMQFA